MGHGLMVEKLSVWALSRERGRGQHSGSRTPSMPVRFGCGPSRPKTKAARQHRTPRHPMCGQLGTQLPLLVACALSAWLGGMHGHDVRTPAQVRLLRWWCLTMHGSWMVMDDDRQGCRRVRRCQGPRPTQLCVHPCAEGLQPRRALRGRLWYCTVLPIFNRMRMRLELRPRLHFFSI